MNETSQNVWIMLISSQTNGQISVLQETVSNPKEKLKTNSNYSFQTARGVRKTQRKLNHNDLFEPTPLTLPLHSSLLAAKHNVVSITEKNTLWSQR